MSSQSYQPWEEEPLDSEEFDHRPIQELQLRRGGDGYENALHLTTMDLMDPSNPKPGNQISFADTKGSPIRFYNADLVTYTDHNGEMHVLKDRYDVLRKRESLEKPKITRSCKTCCFGANFEYGANTCDLHLAPRVKCVHWQPSGSLTFWQKVREFFYQLRTRGF